MCGVAGSGKTTYAKALKADGYVRLLIDEEVWRRFGRYGVDCAPEQYVQHFAAAEQSLARRLLELIKRGR